MPPNLMISKLLFERFWLLLIVLAAIQLGLIAVWSWRRNRPCARAVWIGFATIPLLLLLSVVVVTPREQIIELCNNLAEMVDEGDVDAIGSHLADDFLVAGLNRADFLDRVEETLATHPVDDARLYRIEVTFPRKDEGAALFNAVCVIRSTDFYLDRLLSRWRVTFVDQRAGWLVTGVEVLPTPLSPVRNIRDWLR